MKSFVLALGMSLAMTPAWAADKSPPTEGAATAATMSGDEFAKAASIAGMFEVESSKLALQKSKNPKIKAFAQSMVADHQKAGAKLKAIHPGGVSTELDKTHSDIMDRLEAAGADTFDQTYVAEQTTAHHQAVDLFSGYSKGGENKALQAFATETLPTLKSHLEHVKKLN